MRIPGRFLVQSRRCRDADAEDVSPLLVSDTPLSFWGGLDETSGVIMDQQHPLQGKCVKDTILCLPSGRGSCTASQVLLELILNDTAPRAIVFRDADGVAAVGALIAQEVFSSPQQCALDIVQLGNNGFAALLAQRPSFGTVQPNGDLLCYDSDDVRPPAPGGQNQASPGSEPLQLTPEEEGWLQQAQSEAETMALQVIFRYARMISSSRHHDNVPPPRYLSIRQAHIDGCTYIGPGGLAFCRRLVEAGGQVKVPTTLNSISTDRRQWQQLGLPAPRAQQAMALSDAYLQLGCQPSFTCAPYLLSSPPTLGEQVVWGESNAVVYANSVLGARTEKYADYLDICCALAGMAPAAGVHLTEHRQPQIVLDGSDIAAQWNRQSGFLHDLSARGDDARDALFPTLGHLCGTLSDGKVPILIGVEELAKYFTLDALKAFCAAFGTTGSSPLIHIAGVTPEAKDPARVREQVETCGDNVEMVTVEQLQDTFDALDSDESSDDHVHMIALGNPHLSVSECQKLVELTGKDGGSFEKHKDVRVIACMSRHVHEKADKLGYIAPLAKIGVEFVNDTCWCMLLDPPVIPAKKTARILTNSGKYAHYGPGLTQRAFRFGSLADCVQAARTGVYKRRRRLAADTTHRDVHSHARAQNWQHGGASIIHHKRFFQLLRPLLRHAK